MTDIQLNSTHDLVITNSDISLCLTKEELTIQKVKINLLNYRGEWFRDINLGVPYLQRILGRKGTKDIADISLKNTILETENISSILSYQSSIDTNRNIKVIFSASMESGGSIDNILVEI